MTKFRKKPVVIEAEQWLGTVEQKERLLADGVILEIPSQDGSCLVPTLEGNIPCNLNDWIVQDDNGQRSVCNADIFELTYDLVEDEEVEVGNIEAIAEEVIPVAPKTKPAK